MYVLYVISELPTVHSNLIPTYPQPFPSASLQKQDVELISSRLSGAAGPGGTDAVELSNWLLRFGSESEGLRSKMAAWTNWMAN